MRVSSNESDMRVQARAKATTFKAKVKAKVTALEAKAYHHWSDDVGTRIRLTLEEGSMSGS